VRQFRTPGSARGASSNRRPYLNPVVIEFAPRLEVLFARLPEKASFPKENPGDPTLHVASFAAQVPVSPVPGVLPVSDALLSANGS
jgi:hypothetical protein